MKQVLIYSILTHAAFSGSRVAMALAGLELKASPFAIGLILSFYSLLPMILSVAGGRWVDRVGMRAPMLIGVGVLTFGMAVPLLGWDIGSLYLSSVTVGVGFMAFHICTQKATGDVEDDDKRRENFSLLSIGYSVSAFVGPTAAGLLIDHVGHRLAFGALALVPALTWLAVWRWPLPVGPGRSQAPAPAVQESESKLTDLLRDPALRRLFIAVVVISACWDVHQFIVPLYGAQNGLSATSIGIVLGAYALATFVIRSVLPWLSRHVSEWRLILTAMWSGFGIYLLYPWFPTFPVMVALSFVLGLGLGISQPMILSVLHRSAPPHRVGEAVGLRLMLVNGTQTVLPTAFGAVGSALGLAPVFVGMALFAGGSALVVRRGLAAADLRKGRKHA